MALTLKESRAVSDIADLLYHFLPGSGHSKWKGHVSFKTVAEKVGVGDFWQPGSKTNMIVALLERTLDCRRSCFEPLVLEIVRAGMTYRHKGNNPVRPEEIERLNGLILEVGFKFPQLWDPEFRVVLEKDAGSRAKEKIETAIHQVRARSSTLQRMLQLEVLRQRFLDLHRLENRQRAGLELEGLLNETFSLYSLSPREPFRVVGEQIDGSFELDHEVYLLEAKWEQSPCSENPLMVFREKIEGKSKFTRGVFVSINGVTTDAVTAITKGKQPNFFIINGYDILMVLEGNVTLSEFLRLRQRLLAEEGRVVVPFSDLQAQFCFTKEGLNGTTSASYERFPPIPNVPTQIYCKGDFWCAGPGDTNWRPLSKFTNESGTPGT